MSAPRRIAAGLLVAAVMAIGGGCGGDPYTTLVEGDCLPSSAKVVGTREPDPPTVGCGDPHRYEVYAVDVLDGDAAYPGDEAVDADAKALCFAVFADKVGVDPLDLPEGVKIVYLQPTESSWADEADRDVECLLVFDEDRSGAFIRSEA